MVRTERPYSRAKDTYKRANPDAPGGWKHDLHQSVKSSLASRLSNGGNVNGSSPSSSSSAGASLLNRINGGKGKELLPPNTSGSKLHGFGTAPPPNINNANAGVELLGDSSSGATGSQRRRGAGVGGSKGRLVDSSLNAALGLGAPRRSVVRSAFQQRQSRELLGYDNEPTSFSSVSGSPWGGGRYEQPMQVQAQASVSIMGAARGTTWVRVENLAVGTTTDDVVSAFAPAPISNARISNSASNALVTIEIELDNRASAEEIVSKYNGAVADGNALVVSIIKQGLAERMGRGAAQSQPPAARASQPRQQQREELLAPSGSGKMYSDAILASDRNASVVTLAQQDIAAAQAARAGAWQRSVPAAPVPSLAQRMGGRR